MKSSNQARYFSPNRPRQENAAKTAEQSPYLKAILSAKRLPGQAKSMSLGSSSMAAALRYIAAHK